jgi:hypothetical protein
MMEELWWNILMNKMRENTVIPIIGPRLLVGPDGQTSLQAQVAARLLHDCGKDAGGIQLPPFRELNEAVSLLKGQVPMDDLYDFVNNAINSVTKDTGIPKPLHQLAQITDFRLFVTLTIDELLSQSLKQHRTAVNEIIHSLTGELPRELPGDWRQRREEAQLFYLFGKTRAAPMFAIHDEDMLEYAHDLIVNGEKTHKRFLDELRSNNLLLIGCNFPEWLSRFFLRAANRTRLSGSDSLRKAWLIEQPQPEEGFTCFLNSYGGGTKIISDISPVEFVAELHRRWTQKYGGSKTTADFVANPVAPRKPTFFISYCRRTDQFSAEKLYKALLDMTASEGDVWFDHDSIEPGDDFPERIRDGILNCRYFLPLISHKADALDEAYFYREWGEASERKKAIRGRPFIIPIIVDQDFQPTAYHRVPFDWTDIQDFAHAPEGQPDDKLRKRLTDLLRDVRREGRLS